MKRINKYIAVSADAVYEMVSNTYCRLYDGKAVAREGGTAVAHYCGTAVAYSGGRAEAYSGGRAVAYSGGRTVAYSGGRAVALYRGTAVAYKGGTAVALYRGTAEAYYGGQVCKIFDIADDGDYTLRMTEDERFYAGCRIDLTKEEALKHWDRDDDQALLFTFAIHFFTGAK